MTSQQLTDRILDLSALFQASRNAQQREQILSDMKATADHLQAIGGHLPWN